MTDQNLILLVDDDPAALQALEALFCDVYRTLTARSGPDAIDIVSRHGSIAAVVMDIKMPGMDGITAAREIRTLSPQTPVIFHTGYPGDYDEDDLDERERPFGYVRKADPISKLLRAVRNAVEAYRAGQDIRHLTQQAEKAYGIIGSTAAMREVFRSIRRVGRTGQKTIIYGETGTGKELAARAIHLAGERRECRLVIFNCNHKSPDLIESELFGHLKGAFTGAVGDRIGLFEYADGGTVFLDEIGDLDITTQAKLLRVLETGEFQRVGGPEILTADVRLICATHKNLGEMVEAGAFRGDLFYRLDGVRIDLPPLRERREDIPALVAAFTDRFTIERDLPPKFFDNEAVGALIAFDWPGNVRQLMSTVETLVTIVDSDIIIAADVTRQLGRSDVAAESSASMSLAERLREYKRTLIIQALAEVDQNVSAAARRLGVDRANLRKMILDLNIDIG